VRKLLVGGCLAFAMTAVVAVVVSSPQSPPGPAPPAPARLDRWTIVGPGGGGAFFSPAISPFDPDLVLATSDMTDNFLSENGGRSWRQLNLRTTATFTFDPVKRDRIWASTRGGGSFHSDDRGRTWRLFYPYSDSVTGLWYVDDEGDPYFGVGTQGGYSAPMSAFAVDPLGSEGGLYAAWGGVLRASANAGKEWRDLARGVAARQLFVDPDSSPKRRTVYAVTSDGTGVWEGDRYQANPPAPGAPFTDVSLGHSAKGPPVIYAVTKTPGGLLVTRDGGRSWRTAVSGPLASATFRAVATSRHHPDVVYVSYSGLKLPDDPGAWFGVAKSTDGGAQWSLVWKETGDRPASNIRGGWTTARFGPDWGENPLHMAVDDNNPDRLFTTDLARILRTVDGGANWEALYSRPAGSGYTTTGLDNTTAYGIHFDPFHAGRVFISYTDIGLFRSDDGGRSWLSATTSGVPRAWRNTTYWVEFDPDVPDRMWAVMSRNHDLPRSRTFASRPGLTASFLGGVMASTDGGRTWKSASDGLPQMAATHILLDPASPPAARVLYVAGFGRGVFKSSDGGNTWTAHNTGLPAVEPLAWRLARDSQGALYLVTVRRSVNGSYGGDADGALFRSRDGARSWQKMPLPEGLNGPMSLTPDPRDPTRLYLSAWGRYFPGRLALADQGGVFLSTDAGATWNNVLSANRRIYDVTVDPRNSALVYATGYESSAWRSADRGLTWSRLRGFNFKHGNRVLTDPQDPAKVYIATFGSSVWHGPAEGDPDAAEDIAAPDFALFSVPGGPRKR
jgi:photosystem II stability/assembly factor-like uncharacterized protein